MYSPHRFGYRIGNIGQPLASPFKQLEVNRAFFRRGATSLIAGTPGSFKTVFALNLLKEWAGHGVSSLYFAADSDEVTVVNRLSGIITGSSVETIERKMMQGSRTEYESALKRHLATFAEFEYDQMDAEDVVLHVKSYEQVYGGYPDVIFIDNLIDFVDSPTDYGGMLEFIRDMDALAKEIKAHICILHHAKLRDNKADSDNDAKDPMQPPADWEVQGRITQLSRLVLTITSVGLNVNVACVKNTHGPQTRDASRVFGFTVYPSMKVKDREAV
jgi:AAA domain